MDKREITNWYTSELMDDVPDNIGPRLLTEFQMSFTQLTKSDHVSFQLTYSNPPFHGDAFSMGDWVFAPMQELFNDEDIIQVKFLRHECYISYRRMDDTEWSTKRGVINTEIDQINDELESEFEASFHKNWRAVSITPFR